MKESGSKFCGCGCNQRISANKELKFGHFMPIVAEEPAAEPVKKTRKPRAKKEDAVATEPKTRKPRAKKEVMAV